MDEFYIWEWNLSALTCLVIYGRQTWQGIIANASKARHYMQSTAVLFLVLVLVLVLFLVLFLFLFSVRVLVLYKFIERMKQKDRRVPFQAHRQAVVNAIR